MNVNLIPIKSDDLPDQFQQTGTYNDGKNIEIPILIDQKSKEMLSDSDEITIDMFGWSYFKKLGIRNSSLQNLPGSC